MSLTRGLAGTSLIWTSVTRSFLGSSQPTEEFGLEELGLSHSCSFIVGKGGWSRCLLFAMVHTTIQLH